MLILDLRGNPGGRVDALERLLGGVIDHEIKIADRVGRKTLKPAMSKPHGKVFTGQLIVLVDSQSASAAEIFARVLQLEGRGKVVGDRSSGSVMESLGYQHEAGADIVMAYGASITEADVIMKDGKSLEKVASLLTCSFCRPLRILRMDAIPRWLARSNSPASKSPRRRPVNSFRRSGKSSSTTSKISFSFV